MPGGKKGGGSKKFVLRPSPSMSDTSSSSYNPFDAITPGDYAGVYEDSTSATSSSRNGKPSSKKGKKSSYGGGPKSVSSTSSSTASFNPAFQSVASNPSIPPPQIPNFGPNPYETGYNGEQISNPYDDNQSVQSSDSMGSATSFATYNRKHNIKQQQSQQRPKQKSPPLFNNFPPQNNFSKIPSPHTAPPANFPDFDYNPNSNMNYNPNINSSKNGFEPSNPSSSGKMNNQYYDADSSPSSYFPPNPTTPSESSTTMLDAGPQWKGKYRNDEFTPYFNKKRRGDDRYRSRDVSVAQLRDGGMLNDVERRAMIAFITAERSQKWRTIVCKNEQLDPHERLRAALISALNKATLAKNHEIALHLKPFFGGFDQTDLETAASEVFNYFHKFPHLGDVLAQFVFEIAAQEVTYKVELRKKGEMAKNSEIENNFQEEENIENYEIEDDGTVSEFKRVIYSNLQSEFEQLYEYLDTLDENEKLNTDNLQEMAEFERKLSMVKFYAYLLIHRSADMLEFMNKMRKIAKIARNHENSEIPLYFFSSMISVTQRFVLNYCRENANSSDSEKREMCAKFESNLKFVTDFLRKSANSHPEFSMKLRCYIYDLLERYSHYQHYSGMKVGIEEERERKLHATKEEKTTNWVEILEQKQKFDETKKKIEQILPTIKELRNINEVPEDESEYYFVLFKTRMLYYLTGTDGEKYYSILNRFRRLCSKQRMHFNCAVFFLLRLLEDEPHYWSAIAGLLIRLRDEHQVNFQNIQGQISFGFFHYLKMRYFNPDLMLGLDIPILSTYLVKIQQKLIDEKAFNETIFKDLCLKEDPEIMQKFEELKEKADQEIEKRLKKMEAALEAERDKSENWKKRAELLRIDNLKKETELVNKDNEIIQLKMQMAKMMEELQKLKK